VVELVFQVGQVERHQVTFKFNKFWGLLSITVDGRKVVNTMRVGSISLVKTYDFVVGVEERHQVRIEKHREQLFAGFRPQKIFAFVDGRPVAQGVA
jgi:hypothetical protein